MDSSTQQNLFESGGQATGPVECLGLTFENDEVRRSHFLAILREKLKDPEFRKIEGFPIGEDEDILALSDPPYYTACPNPFLEDFIRCYGKPYDPETDDYHREPYSADLSASRNNSFVNAHSYATKVPYEIVMKLMLHYTNPGDIVLDAYAGTGMTSVAGQFCEDKNYVTEIYSPKKDKSSSLNTETNPIRVGARKVICGDLSPAATFLSSNFNLPLKSKEFQREAEEILEELEKKYEWLYQTRHSNGEKGTIICTLWSDILICSNCSSEICFWKASVNSEDSIIEDPISCPHCKAKSKKSKLEHACQTKWDSPLGESIKQFKQNPVLIIYEFGNKRFEKKPDKDGLFRVQGDKPS